MIEPNPHLFRLPVYAHADAAFNIALSNDSEGTSIVPLYLVDGDVFGQGSSLFTTKPNVDTGRYLMVLNSDVRKFAQQLKDYFAKTIPGGDYTVVLRINNEGAESDAIRGFAEVFPQQFKLVLGSLKDVIAVKGAQELKSLESFMAERGIGFTLFYTTVSSWPGALRSLLALTK
jgi:hypothetical protein